MGVKHENSLTSTCPHCGVTVSFPALTDMVNIEYEDDIDLEDHEITANFKDSFFISTCANCKKPVMVGTSLDDLTQELAIVTYPRYVKKVSSNLPNNIRNDMNEIYRCMSVWAYAATCVMCRRLIQLCCQHFQCEGKSLMSQIDDLLTHKFPNETLRRQAHLIRSIGNEEAHATGKAQWHDTEILVAFCEEITHHLFITQEKFQEITKRREKMMETKDKLSTS